VPPKPAVLRIALSQDITAMVSQVVAGSSFTRESGASGEFLQTLSRPGATALRSETPASSNEQESEAAF
jgi:hypothetical protein